MARSTAEIGATTYAVLGLLCLRPWSAYELTQQMARSLRFIWPRAESGIYREPQKLVDIGYATAREVPAGPRRTKTVYSATAEGRQAMQHWLARPAARPQFESEALLKFFFADLGTIEDALRALEALATQAESLLDVFRAITASYAEGPGPFAERLHIGSLIGRYLFEHAQTMLAWASWATAHVREWPETGPGAAILGQRVQLENARLARVGPAALALTEWSDQAGGGARREDHSASARPTGAG
ncbi:MAG: PadR family transcriptional regulator [Chloroflexi bacterium]|nr:PadR family transcriptional regulator [Chloroflexota bacterium]